MSEKNQFRRCILSVLALIVFGNLSCAQQPEPQITAVEPNLAATTPGAKVTVVGVHLPPDSIVYFGGLQARETAFISATVLQAVTPYLRPGKCKLDLKSGETIIHSDVDFTAGSTPIDSVIDQAEALAARNQREAAVQILTNIATTHPDYDVRAYAHYRAGQLYLALGDYRKAAVESALIWDEKVSRGVQSSWRYGLLYAQTAYSVSESNDQDTDLRIADWVVRRDVTENPEPHFWRALVNARFGKMEQAKADLKFILAAEPGNPSYRALAAYAGVLSGDKTQLEASRGQQVNDERALALLGQAAYITGDSNGAQSWWADQGKIGIVQAKLDCAAGRKHVEYGQTSVGVALLKECTMVVPDSPEAKEAQELLAKLQSPSS